MLITRQTKFPLLLRLCPILPFANGCLSQALTLLPLPRFSRSGRCDMRRPRLGASPDTPALCRCGSRPPVSDSMWTSAIRLSGCAVTVLHAEGGPWGVGPDPPGRGWAPPHWLRTAVPPGAPHPWPERQFEKISEAHCHPPTRSPDLAVLVPAPRGCLHLPAPPSPLAPAAATRLRSLRHPAPPPPPRPPPRGGGG
jgi:hypothetical protein